MRTSWSTDSLPMASGYMNMVSMSINPGPALAGAGEFDGVLVVLY
jgi:hypothetical protein